MQKASRLYITDSKLLTLCEGNPLVTSGFPPQRASNLSSVSMCCPHQAIQPAGSIISLQISRVQSIATQQQPQTHCQHGSKHYSEDGFPSQRASNLSSVSMCCPHQASQPAGSIISLQISRVQSIATQQQPQTHCQQGSKHYQGWF